VKTARLVSIVATLLLLGTPTAALAEGWGLPNLNPFAAKSKKPASNFASQRKPQPSTWQKLSKGTASTWNKTTSALTPWKTETTGQPRVTGNGARMASKPAKSKTSQASGATWYKPHTWFSSEEKPATRQPGSVPDFIGQPRIPY
jgi:hypothetical protein